MDDDDELELPTGDEELGTEFRDGDYESVLVDIAALKVNCDDDNNATDILTFTNCYASLDLT